MSITASADTAFNAPTYKLSATTVTSNVTATVTAGSVKALTLNINGFGTVFDDVCGNDYNTTAGLNSITVTRTSSPYKGAATGTLIVAGQDTSATVYYGDVLTASISVETAYTGSLTWTSKTITANTTLTGSATVKSYKLTISSLPTGVASVTVSRTSSPNGGGATGALSNGATIYYGDVLSASATATTGYNNPTLNWTSKTVTGNVTSTATAGSVKSFKLTISSKPTGVNTHTVSRTSSPLGGGATGALSNGATIYYGDVLSASATATTPYNAPTLNWTSQTVTGNVTSTATAGSVKSYTLTMPALPTGVASCYVSRTSSPNKGAATGTLVTAGSSQKTATIYYGDVLSISATATTGYTSPTASLSATTVTGNVTATIKAGTVTAIWHTVWEDTDCGTTLDFYATSTGTKTYTLSGLKAGVPTKCVFTVTVKDSSGSSSTWNNSGTEDSDGSYSGIKTGTSWVSYEHSYTLKMASGKIEYSGSGSGIYIDEDCGIEETYGFSRIDVSIRSIQQYY